MGNCMERDGEKQQEEEKETATSIRLVKINDGEGKNNGLRMKVVLTKEELKWLILQLNEKGTMRLEQVLGEIEKGREEKVEGWKPSLESILEAPEILEMDSK
ncbi:hypothetical protein RJT34_05279 [Clitoria ternatea]|uniref:Uncharacterized protein n=1 Tax=Clitoria ternatea TaxID=43366 RepID=A0AAN9K1Y0_CLITE